MRQFAPIRATRGFFEKNLYINAAAIAFFGVLAFVPTLVLVVLFGGFLLQSHEPLYRTVQNQLAELFPSLPEDFLRISMGFIQNPASIGVSGAVFFFLGFDMLLQALRVSVYKISGEKTKDGFFASRLISLLMIVGLGVTLAVSASAGTITEFVRAFVQERPFVPAWVEKILEFSPTQIALSMGGIAVFLTALLWVLPESRVPFKVALLCGVVGSVLWEAAKKGFTFYVFRIARTSYFYGSLSAMMMFLLWFYYSALLMLWVFELAFELLRRPKSVSAE